MKVSLEEIRAKAAEYYNGEKGFGNARRLNAYECDGQRSFRPGVPDKPGCGHFIVTIDREPGVTPFIVSCGNCGQSAHSKFYKVAASLTPTHEWYRPDTLEGLDKWDLEHVEKGGLLLRPIGDAAWQSPEERERERLMAMKKELDARMDDMRRTDVLSRQAARHEARKSKIPPETVQMHGRTYRLAD